MPTIETNPNAEPVDADILRRLREIPVALLSDQLHRNRGTALLKPYHSPAPMAGTALTVRTRGGDNLAILRAFHQCRPGDVLVIDADGETANALVGGIMTFHAATIGMAGMVLDGAVRDIAELGARTFPVYARGHTHRGPYKDGPGAINVPVSVGGMLVHPGDIVVGDQDGILAFGRQEAETVIAGALAQHAKEEATMQAIRENRWDLSFVDALEARAVN
ncbi:RraA family protein [Antarcticirhabdus aurantiaca]|uniref:RraA family protein n=1 Tax=Antarcticirhabdus aurantiaca TaxID=2606717 RepID=A0ACD4NTB1_9HYPH|nr:RraA family protein [Antarcticirhabdus aurantiaca]WAJ29936.1 RraA family protein [Jeongeuplla avenae]